MRLLLISDTHGHLGALDALAARLRPDAVIHAGDFGFYDDGSPDRLEARELFLRVVHSDLPEDEKKRAKKLSGDKMRQFIRDRLPLSDLGAWLRDGRGFSVPVYAVWGNHEDRAVVESLLDGRARVPNLSLLGASAPVRLGPLHIFGLGGNILSSRLADHPKALAGEGGKIWTTLIQIGQLAEAMSAPRAEGDLRVLVSHVSPGKEPLLVHLCALLDVDVTVSGHMGAPWTIVWDEFSVRDPTEAQSRLAASQASVAQALRAPLPEDPALRAHVERAKALLERLPDPFSDERGVTLPRWYRGGFHVNLPDAPDGHAVLSIENGRASLETFSAGFALRRRAAR